MRARYLWLALLLACAPAPVVAQRPGPGPEAQHRKPMHGPVEKLLQNRAELQLSAEQVSRLEQIDARMRDRNRAYVQRLIELRRGSHFEPHVRREEMTPEQRAEFDRRVAEVRPLLEKIHANNWAAMKEVGSVLNPEQKARVREMLRDTRERHERDDSDGHRGGRGR